MSGMSRQVCHLPRSLVTPSRPRAGLGRRGAEGADGFGADGHDLAEEELPEFSIFVRLGRPVSRRPALDHVADVDIVTRERNAFL